MMLVKNVLFVVVGLAGMLFCGGCFTAEKIHSTYNYKGFDTNGVLVVEGILNLDLNDTNRVRGEWRLHEMNPGTIKKLGPQLGSGKLVGKVQRDKINLNLNPGTFDNDVILSGQVTTNNIFGIWEYDGFAGQLGGGKFEAMKK